MHSATQIIAQRAPPASRTTKAARWQPYYSLQSTTSNLPIRSPYLNTPSTNVSSPKPVPPAQPSSSDPSRSRPPISATTAQTPKENPQRDSSKHKFAVGLIDQAVNTLSDIWRPQDVPAIFLAPVAKTGGCSFPPSAIHSSTKSSHINGRSSSIQVPPSPSTQPPPFSAELGQTAVTPTAALALLASGIDSDQAVLPLKTFVHEVLRRSRTSGNVLQTALCYLEAIRPKIPEILLMENAGIRTHFQPESRIQPATQAELEREVELSSLEADLDDSQLDDSLKTIRVTDCGPEELEETQHRFDDMDKDSLSSLIVEPSIVSAPSSSSSSSFSSSFSSLPSPLLCPRRAFLASLILASKFSQDKCYSNRAWAKLSGLPPREIGRCERALGQALQWRLWVGKSPVGPQAENAPAMTPIRAVVRSQSEGSIVSPTTCNRPFMNQDKPASKVNTDRGLSETPPHKAGGQTGLRRCSTLPADLLATSAFQPNLCSSHVVSGHQDDQDMETMYSDYKQEDQMLVAPLETKISSSPATPGLSYSPSSTDSSGDRTIQMSTLEDNMFSSSFNGNGWLNLTDSACRTASPLSFVSGPCRYDSKDLAHDLAVLQSQTNPISVVDVDVATFGANYLWNTDNRYLLEATGVH